MHSRILPTWDCGQAAATARVNNWYDFVAILETNFLDWTEYIFRGQRDTSWTLRSKFDREYRSAIQLLEETDPLQRLDEQDRSLVNQSNPDLSLDSRNNLLERHLARFKKFCTGRRGISPKNLTDNEWWALGQHFGAEYANRGLERESADLLWKAQPAFIRRMLSNDAYHDSI